MAWNEVQTLITSVGFPIVCCGALFWYIVKVQKELTQVITSNTLAISELVNRFSKEGDDGK